MSATTKSASTGSLAFGHVEGGKAGRTKAPGRRRREGHADVPNIEWERFFFFFFPQGGVSKERERERRKGGERGREVVSKGCKMGGEFDSPSEEYVKGTGPED